VVRYAVGDDMRKAGALRCVMVRYGGALRSFLDHIPGPHDVINDVTNDIINEVSISDGQNQYLNFHFSTFFIFAHHYTGSEV